MVEDAIRTIDEGRGIRRELSLQNPQAGLYIRLGEAETIEEMSKGLYLVDDKVWYLRLDETGGAKATIRNKGGRQELIIPLREKISYCILY